jgi:hypothetical protein
LHTDADSPSPSSAPSSSRDERVGGSVRLELEANHRILKKPAGAHSTGGLFPFRQITEQQYEDYDGYED